MIVYDRLWETMKKKGISQYSLIKDYVEDICQHIKGNPDET